MPPQTAATRDAAKTETSSTPHIAIQAQNVTLSLGEGDARVDILGGIDLSITTGTTVALLGPSGSGKSSLMAILSGLERATGGTVNIAGADFGAMNEDELAVARRGRVGIVLQAFHLLPTMTALENVAVPLELDGQKDPFAIAAKELAAVGLGDRLGHYPMQLSGGEQQRVAIARAMASRPSIIFADEPTGNLDQTTGEKIIALLFERQMATQATLLIITHDPELAKRCDRIVSLRDGMIETDSGA
ncbi:ABC transporter ATP-binding protein [Parasphingorhabdus halotolerans]|uniref:ATP-binding cassette domain-containing protein n=1 Tax=Parasphingorhabdus halotolerans TaxID=2725558 RepID=A0A6H2DJ05_9SPHN|nr:ATP-binding cassette domain-containing protein [Parasphingorhabdus halotolerans]QJB68659.1 ATP-binding cassette domain-containing protein [Parasphingorhabdus halotolerans]